MPCTVTATPSSSSPVPQGPPVEYQRVLRAFSGTSPDPVSVVMPSGGGRGVEALAQLVGHLMGEVGGDRVHDRRRQLRRVDVGGAAQQRRHTSGSVGQLPVDVAVELHPSLAGGE